MEPLTSFVAELVIVVIILSILLSRFWVIRHQRRGPEDWIRDVLFATSTLLCIATTSCLAWYCWESIEVYKQATLVVDQKLLEKAANSTIDLASMTAAQLADLNSKIQAERNYKIEGLATIMLLDPWYRRFIFFIWGGYFTELWLLKGAFLAFYWRLFSRVQSRFVYLLYATTVFVIVTYIIVFTIHFTWCTPVHRNWTIPLQEFPGTSAINSLTTLTIGSFLNIVTDIMILVLPLLIIQSFKLRRREKFGMCFVFVVGIMCVTASVVRYVIMYIPFKSPPATMQGVRVSFLWSSLEVLTGFIAFCLPSFRLVFLRAIKRGKETCSNKRRSTGKNAGGYSSGGLSDSKHPSIGSTGARSKKKSLPRHPNTLLTEDFVTLNTIQSGDEEAQNLERNSIPYPPVAVTGDGGGWQSTHIGVSPERHLSQSDVNGIHVTNTIVTSTSSHQQVEASSDRSEIPSHYSFPLPRLDGSRPRHGHLHHHSYSLSMPQHMTPIPTPPRASFGSGLAAEDTVEEYVLMPMQRAYNHSEAHTGSRENLRAGPESGWPGGGYCGI